MKVKLIRDIYATGINEFQGQLLAKTGEIVEVKERIPNLLTGENQVKLLYGEKYAERLTEYKDYKNITE